ncbi:DNA/RNA non-specific endonuclease [Rhodoglobus aureus]|uniref:DNA/RNA non-specific endonuclease n=1 Tax=Rhodoglobus aureus TaxID=191497 RepID=A0ABN1VZP4_9MICO
MTQRLGMDADLGYDPNFLSIEVAAPTAQESIRGDVLLWDGGAILPYTHFSLAMIVARRFAYWVAWNIDGGALKKLSRAKLAFMKDERIPPDAQTGNELYSGNRLDRGHLARRSDLIWGALEKAQMANSDSFYYTNIAPQMDDFNQSSQQGVWGRLEDALYEDVEVDDLRVSVMAGPVFLDDDQVYRGVRVPREYWKILAYSLNDQLSVRAFLLTQDLDAVRSVTALDEFRVYQVDLFKLEERTGLLFPAVMHSAGVGAAELLDAGARTAVDQTSGIRW